MLLAGYPLQQAYLRDRYTGSAQGELPSAKWFQHENSTRVGVVGQFAYLQYPFYGQNLSNYVQYLGVPGPHGTYSSFDSCTAWREAIDRGRYSYVYITTNEVTTRSALPSAALPEMKWMAPGKDSKVVLGGQVRTHSHSPATLPTPSIRWVPLLRRWLPRPHVTPLPAGRCTHAAYCPPSGSRWRERSSARPAAPPRGEKR